MNSITSAVNLTDAQIEARFAELDVLLAIDLGDSENIEVTSDSIEDFVAARSRWAQKGHVVKANDSVLSILDAQVSKGQPRRDLTVINFGEVRLAVWL